MVLDRLHLYYDLPLITFGIDKDMNLIIQFPVFIQPYTQKPLILYQLETVPVPVLDKNTNAQSYMPLQIRKPYITLNSETYISLRQQELRSCKRTAYDFYCEELFVVKHKSSYSCESAIYFNLATDIIKNNCNFNFYFNKTDITPTMLDGGDEIVLANWPNDKHIICYINNDIPVRIPSHPYVLVNRSILCNCSIEADNHYLLESIAAYDNKDSKLVMYFTIKMAFANYLDMFSNLTDSFPLFKDKTMYEQPFPINLSVPDFDRSLLHEHRNLKCFTQDYTKNIEIFDLEERHVPANKLLKHSNKNFFSNNYIVDIFMFTSSVISLISTTLIVYLFCKHKQIRALMTSLILHKIKNVEASSNDTNSECKTLAYIGITLTILSLIIVTFLHYRKSRLCKGHKFSNAAKIMLFISDVQNYVPIKLCKTADSIHLFKIKGTLKPKDIKSNRNYLWDTLEIDWKDVTVTFNDNKINLPRIVVVRLHDKIRVRRLMSREPFLFHMMINQRISWFTSETEISEIL